MPEDVEKQKNEDSVDESINEEELLRDLSELESDEIFDFDEDDANFV